MCALRKARKKVDNNWTSEIDKYAIKVQEHHFPSAIQLGDITKWKNWKIDQPDLIIGGSPCQDLSKAGKDQGKYGLLGERSRLFYTLKKILDHFQPKYFVVENVVMKPEWRKQFDKLLGVDPILIDSKDFTAQRRSRYYWTNIPVDPWVPTKQTLDDIVVSGKPIQSKSYCIDANYFKGGPGFQMLFDYYINKKGKRYQAIDRCLVMDGGTWRKFTPLECERLQGYPDGYTDVGISNTQRYKSLGNSFTVPVIAHILKNI